MPVQTIQVHLLPQTVDAETLDGSCVIVIDVFRASTTIVHALANGARKMILVRSSEIARSLVASSPQPLLTAGEFKAVKPEGFDFGNSPAEFSFESVHGRDIVFTTTIGTVALSKVVGASAVMVGCFANISAIVRAARTTGLAIQIVCAGTRNRPSLEDTLAAGAMAEMFLRTGDYTLFGDDSTRMVAMIIKDLGPSAFTDLARTSVAADRLHRLGFDHDVSTALVWDTHSVVPEVLSDETFESNPIIALQNPVASK